MIKIFFQDLPPRIYGATQHDKKTGIFWVLIDSKQCDLRKRYIFGHELAHVILHHHDSKETLAENEAEANRRAWEFYREHKAVFYQLQRSGKAIIV